MGFRLTLLFITIVALGANELCQFKAIEMPKSRPMSRPIKRLAQNSSDDILLVKIDKNHSVPLLRCQVHAGCGLSFNGQSATELQFLQKERPKTSEGDLHTHLNISHLLEMWSEQSRSSAVLKLTSINSCPCISESKQIGGKSPPLGDIISLLKGDFRKKLISRYAGKRSKRRREISAFLCSSIGIAQCPEFHEQFRGAESSMIGFGNPDMQRDSCFNTLESLFRPLGDNPKAQALLQKEPSGAPFPGNRTLNSNGTSLRESCYMSDCHSEETIPINLKERLHDEHVKYCLKYFKAATKWETQDGDEQHFSLISICITLLIVGNSDVRQKLKLLWVEMSKTNSVNTFIQITMKTFLKTKLIITYTSFPPKPAVYCLYNFDDTCRKVPYIPNENICFGNIPRLKRKQDTVTNKFPWLDLEKDTTVTDAYKKPDSLSRYFRSFIPRIPAVLTNFPVTFLPQIDASAENTMSYLGYRLASMRALPASCPVSRVRLATAGFFYDNRKTSRDARDIDEVVCYSCGVTHNHWKAEDNPICVHRSIRPDCEHLKNLESENANPSNGFLSTDGYIPMALSTLTPLTEGNSSGTAVPIGSGNGSSCQRSSALQQPMVATGRAEASEVPSISQPASVQVSNPNKSNVNGDLVMDFTSRMPVLATSSPQDARQEIRRPELAETSHDDCGHRQQCIPTLSSPDVPRLSSVDVPRLSSVDVPRLSLVDDPRLSLVDDPRLSSPDVPRLSSPDVPRLLSSPDVPRLSSPDVPRLSSPDVPRLSSPDVPRLPSPVASRALFADLDDRPPLSADCAVYPQFSLQHQRLATFTTWTLSLPPEHLVRQGFYYAGYADCVRCFYCGVGLKSWKKNDDVMTEHIRWHPTCGYVLNTKGKQFVNAVLQRLQVEKNGAENTSFRGCSGTVAQPTQSNLPGPSTSSTSRNAEQSSPGTITTFSSLPSSTVKSSFDIPSAASNSPTSAFSMPAISTYPCGPITTRGSPGPVTTGEIPRPGPATTWKSPRPGPASTGGSPSPSPSPGPASIGASSSPGPASIGASPSPGPASIGRSHRPGPATFGGSPRPGPASLWESPGSGPASTETSPHSGPASTGGSPRSGPARTGGSPRSGPASTGGSPRSDPANIGGSPRSGPANIGESPGSDSATTGESLALLKHLEEMGFSKDTIVRAVRHLQHSGVTTVDVSAMVEAIHQLDANISTPTTTTNNNNSNNNNNNNNNINNAITTVVNGPSTVEQDGGPQNDGAGDSVTDSSCVDAGRIQSIRQENERLRALRRCRICNEADLGAIFLPCGHLLACPTCASRTTNCILCGMFIRATAKVYMN